MKFHKSLGVKLGLGSIGWHTFRHTYRSWLDETGAPMKVQARVDATRLNPNDDERLRKSDVFIKAGNEREAVERVLKPMKASA